MIKTDELTKKIIKCVLLYVECTHTKSFGVHGKQADWITYSIYNESECEDKINKLVDRAILST